MIIVNNSNDNVLVEARLLHQQLKVSTAFMKWIQRRIEEFNFEEGKDFWPNLAKSQNWFGRPRMDFHITMDMAKELAMLERNEVGQKMRRYFIAVEKEARRQHSSIGQLPENVHGIEINGRTIYPYRMMAIALGYGDSGSIYRRIKTHPDHFLTFNGLIHVSEEFAKLMLLGRKQIAYRNHIQKMQPLLPAEFGTTPIARKGGAK